MPIFMYRQTLSSEIQSVEPGRTSSEERASKSDTFASFLEWAVSLSPGASHAREILNTLLWEEW